MRTLFNKMNPAVPQRWLLLLAGLLWTGVGTFLCFRAFGWVETLHETSADIFLASGAACAVAGNRFIFTHVARKNIRRIAQLPQKACVFAFTGWRGYAMIAVMMTAGIFLRSSSLPKHILAALYTAMGGALVLSSVVFYRSYWQTRCSREQ